MKARLLSLPNSLKAALVLGVVLVANTSGRAQSTLWIRTPSSSTTNWSDIANWSSGVPGPVLIPAFDSDSSPGSAAGLVDNVVDQNFTVPGFEYRTLSSSGYHTTLIPSGVTLSLGGSSPAASVSVTAGFPLTSGLSVYSRFVGPGTLSLNTPASHVFVVSGGSDADHYATLDLSGLTNFSAIVTQVFVGSHSDTATYGERPMGQMFLAETNFIKTKSGITSPGVVIGSYQTDSTNLRGTQRMTLGQHNVFNSDGIVVAGHKLTAAMSFRAGLSSPNVTFRGTAGGGDKVKLFTIGDNIAGMYDYARGATSRSPSGTLDLSAGIVDLLVENLFIARSIGTTGTGASTGTASFGAGTVTADNVYIAYHVDGLTGSGNATGTLNLNGSAVMNVANNLTLARKVGPSTPAATVNLGGAAQLNVSGDIITSGGTSTLNLNGGTINMQPGSDATPGNITISTLSGEGTISGAANITANSSLNPGTATLPGTLALAGNLTLPANASVTFNLGNSPAAPRDVVTVAGNLTLNNNPLLFVPLGDSLQAGSYPLFEVAGSISGTLNFTNTSRYVVTLQYDNASTPKRVNLVVSGTGAVASLKWASAASTSWDFTATNWLNGATPDRFFAFDSVLFDQSVSTTNLVLLTGTIPAGTVTVNSSTRNYTFGGSGKLSGGSTIIKNGASSLAISNANDFAGPVTVNGGTLRLANNSALGTTNSGLTINPGATLDVGGYGAGLDLVTISGTGLNNTGAVINSGARADNAIRLLSLAGDATVATYGLGRWDVRGAGGNGTFSGLLDLNGYTLTSMGATQFSVVDSTVTNVGNFNVAGGTLSLTRSKVEGPGYINVSSNNFFIENYTTGYVSKPIVINNGLFKISGSAFTLWSPITNLAGGMRMDVGSQLAVTNIISGPGAITKSGTATLLYEAANTYTGPTTVSGGRLALGTNATLVSTPSIILQNNSTFDVIAQPAGFTLAPGQTLGGSGSVIGNVTAGNNTSVLPGTSAGTLAFSNNLVLDGITTTFELSTDPNTIGNNVNDLITVAGDLTLAGLNSIKVVPLQNPLNNATPYTLFTYAGSRVGGLANLSISSDSRYQFSIVDPITTPGSIQVSITGSGAAADLVWKGNNSALWDTKATPNWLRDGLTPDTFYLGDNVTFDNTASTYNVSLVGNVRPAQVGVTNGINYTFGGTGSLIAGGLAKEGTGSLTLSNSGDNTISAGAIFNGGTVNFQNTGANTFASGATIIDGTLRFANPVDNVFNAPLKVNGGSVIFDQPVTVTFAGSLTDDGLFGTFEKRNGNILALTGNNSTFNGPIIVSAGTLQARSGTALGTTLSPTTVASGATLDIFGVALNNPGEEVIISGHGVANRGAIINDSPTEVQNGFHTVSLAADASIGAPNVRWDIRGNGGSGSFSGSLNLNNHTLSKRGPGRISIVDANVTLDGSIVINEGTLSMTRCNVDGLGTIDLRTNTLWLENYSSGYINKSLTSSGGRLNLTGNAFSLQAAVTNLVGGLTLDLAQNLTMTGPITGPGPLTKAGASTAILTSLENSWAGGTTIEAATLQIGSGPGLADGSLPDHPVVNNGNLFFNSALNFTNTTGIHGTGTLSKRGDGFLYLSASNSFSGNVTTGSGAPASGGTIVINNNYALGISNKSVSMVRAELQLFGPLTLATNIAFLTSANSDVADVGIGLVAIRNMTGNNTLNGPITLTSGGGSSEFKVDAGQLTLNGNATPDTTSRAMILSGVAPGTFNGALTNNGSNIPNLEKRNEGTWTLNGSNTFTGTTTVRGGTLVLGATGSVAGSSRIEVQTNATFNVAAIAGGFIAGTNQTLAGEGTIVGATTANGTVAPGAVLAPTIGKLTFANNLVLAGITALEIDRTNAPIADLLAAPAITCGGTLMVTNLGEELQVGDTFNLIDAAITGTFSQVILPTLPSGMSWDSSKLYSEGTISVKAGVTPINISVTVTGNSLDITWPTTGWTLQAQTNSISIGLTGNWSTVPGSTTTNRVILPIDPANGSVFLRLIQ